MAFVHGRKAYVSLGGDDLSPYTNASEFSLSADSHDVTCYGDDAHVFAGGLLNGTASMSGVYDSSNSAGPRAVIKPLLGTVVELIRRPEGTGSGLPQDAVDVLVTGYSESAPVADMVTWSCDMQLSGEITTTTQGA